MDGKTFVVRRQNLFWLTKIRGVYKVGFATAVFVLYEAVAVNDGATGG